MPKYIKPKFSFTSNSESATTDAGPSSIAMSLVTTPTDDANGRLTVDVMEIMQIETSTTLNANANGTNGPIDGSALAELGGADADGGDNLTAGTVGGLIYLKNKSTTTNENIFIGIVAAGGSNTPTAPAAGGSGGTTTCLDNDTHDTLRTMTLKPGEFAFFPWDYVGDLHWQAQTGTPELEYIRFDRG